MFVGNELEKLKNEHPEIEVESIEVTFNLKKAWKEGIRMFPALKIGKDVLSGLILTRKTVRDFVEAHL